MSIGTTDDNRAFADKMTERLKQEQENECARCPHKPTCTWYIVEHKEQIESMLNEVLDPTMQHYRGTALEGLDAYGRQLKRFDINKEGKQCDL